MGQGVPVLRLYPADPGQKLPDGSAVAEQGHRLIRVLLGDGADGALHPFPCLLQALPIGGLPGGVAAIELGQALPVHLPNFAPGVVLPTAHVDLPQAGVSVQRKPFGQIDCLGCNHGAGQVAGVYRVNRDVCKTSLQGLNLSVTVAGDQGIIPTVDPPI